MPEANLRASDLQGMMPDKPSKLPLAAQPGTDWRYGPSVDIQGYSRREAVGAEARCLSLRTRESSNRWRCVHHRFLGRRRQGESRHEHVHLWAGQASSPRRGNPDLPAKPAFLSGSGGLLSSDRRLLQVRADRNAERRPGQRQAVLKASTVELMRTNVLAPGVDSRDTFGLAFSGRLASGLTSRS